MKHSKPALVALVLTVGLAMPSAAQQAPVPPQTTASEACAEYFGCLEYGSLTEAQARTARGHPQFVEPRAASVHSQELRATDEPALRASPIVAATQR